MQNNFSKCREWVPRGTSQHKWRWLTTLLLILTLGIGQMWGALTTKSDFSDGDIFILSQSNVDAATWIEKGSSLTSSTTGTQTPQWKPVAGSTSADVAGTSEKFYKMKKVSDNRQLTLKVSGVSKITFYTHATSTNRTLRAAVDGGSATNLVTASTSNKTYKGDLELTANATHTIVIDLSNEGYVTALKVTVPSLSGDVDPVFTYTPATYTLGSTDPLDLSTTLTSTNTTGAITFAIKDAAGTGASIANSKNFTATDAGTAKVTVTQAASTGFNEKSQDIDVTVAAPDPCHKYFWFAKAGDVPTGITNNENSFFGSTPGGSGSMTASITIDEVQYNITGRSSNATPNISFTVPANKSGKLYVVAQGSSGRSLVLKKGTTTIQTISWTTAKGDEFNPVGPGEYSLTCTGGHVGWGMLAVKVCDAEFHTITLDLDGGTGATSVQALDGAAATKPADPTKEHCTFAGWYKGADEYDWTTAVTTPFTLTAHWTQLYTISFKAGDGSGDAPAAVADKAQGETFPVPANTFTAPANKVFAGWNDGTNDYAPGDTYTVGTANVVLTAQWVANSYEAKIGTTMYSTFAEALTHAADGDIVLLKDIDVTAQVEIAAGVTATIDLAGHKIEYKGDATLPSGVLLVHNGASLTVNDSSDPDAGSIVSGNKAYAAIALTMAGDDASAPAELTVNGGNLYGYYYAITGNGSRHNTVTTINNCVITTSDEGLGIFHPQDGTLTINNATITGHDAAIEMRAGTLVINDGTFTATATAYSIAPNGSGSTTVGAALAIAQHTTQKPVSVTINGGTFNGVKAINEANPQGNPAPEIALAVTDGSFTGAVTTVDVNHFVSGGTFDAAVAAENCADNYAPKDNGDGTYGVKPLAQSIDLATYAQSHTGTAWQGYLTDNGYAYVVGSESKAEISLDNSNAFDRGLKLKQSTTSNISFEVAAGKLITIVTGKVNGLSIAINGAAATAIAGGTDAEHLATSYYYNAAAQNVVITETNTGYNIIREIKIENPYVVTYNPTEGTCATASANYIGTALKLPTPTHATYSFKGWYDAATGGNLIGAAGADYTPTASITLYAQWETVSTVNTLSDLQVDGATIDGFDPATQIYYLVYEYGRQPEITSATATAGDLATVTINNTPVHYQDATEDFWYVQVKVVPESGDNDKKFYQVRYTNRPKKGVELIKVMIPNGTGNAQDIDAENITGYIGGTANQKLESGKHKLGSGGHYIGITLAEGTFLENDLVNVNIETVTGDKLRVFSENTAAEAKVVAQSAANMVAGVNTVTLGATTTNSLYLRRGTNDENYQKGWNPFVGYISVERYMDPFIESFMIGTVSGTITGNTIAIELPHNTDLTGVAATVEAYANGSATVDAPTELAYNTPLVYTVSSAYTEDAPVAYTVTITEAAAIKEVVIDGTLAVLEGENTTLSAVVYDTNDEVAAIQDVTWSVKAGDTDLASVDANGVVTGKAVGTAHIIATSVADNTKFAEVEVVVSENPCRAWSNPSSKETGATIGKMVVTPTGLGTLQTNMTPYQGAEATNAWKLDSKDSRYAEIKFTDNAQFESLLLGVSSKDNDKNYKFAVVCSSAAGNGFADGVLSATTYEAVDQDEVENLVDVELPTGTKAVRVYREYTNGSSTIGGGSSVFLYYIRACKKELVALTSIAVADKTLAVGVAGTPAVTLTPANADVNSYAWEIVNDGTDAATINPTTGAVSSTATGVVTVKVTATDALNNVVASNVATINIVNKFVEVVPVTATQEWNWTPVSVDANGPTIEAPDTVLANYLSGDEWKMLAGANGDRPYRDNNKNKAYQGYKLSMKTTVPGMLTIKARYASSATVYLKVNGNTVATLGENATNYSVAVPSGDVIITADGSQPMRIYWMKFDTDLAAYELTDNALNGYTRPVTEGRYGTICLPNGGVMTGAMLFDLAYFDPDQKKIFFDEVINGTMEAGTPYIFLPNEGVDALKVFYTDAADVVAGNANGLFGSYTQETVTPNDGNYILLNNQYCFVNSTAYVGANRAYIKLYGDGHALTASSTSAPQPAPGRRRVSMGVQGEQVATGIEGLNVGDQPIKVVIDGQMYILRGDKMYDATGRLVK